MAQVSATHRIDARRARAIAFILAARVAVHSRLLLRRCVCVCRGCRAALVCYVRVVSAVNTQRCMTLADGAFFVKLLSVVVGSAAYPAGFTTWAACDEGWVVDHLPLL